MRPTAMIREVLLLQLLEDTVHRALIEAKQDLADANVKIIDMNDDGHSINVLYKAENFEDEGIYMKKMLDAEARGYLRRLPDVKRFLESE